MATDLKDLRGAQYAQRGREGERHDERREDERRPPARFEERREEPRGHEARRPPPPHFAEFRRGARLAAEYRHRNYVVTDWRIHRLHAPPRGYHWVQAGPDYLLVAIATGIIAEVLADGQAVAAPPPGAAPLPPSASTGGPAAWYFCPSANAYYPYVSQCPDGWQVVPASPPPG